MSLVINALLFQTSLPKPSTYQVYLHQEKETCQSVSQVIWEVHRRHQGYQSNDGWALLYSFRSPFSVF